MEERKDGSVNVYIWKDGRMDESIIEIIKNID
jgi:hypothetical protein